MRKVLLLGAILLLFTALPVTAQPPPKTAKGKYTVARLERFEVAANVEMSKERVNVLMLEIAEELYKLKKFKDVIEPGKPLPPAMASAQVLRISGTVTDFYSLLPEGSPTLMGSEFVGHIKVNVVFSEGLTGEKLLEKEIAKRVVAGPYQLVFHGLTQRTAKELAQQAKKTFF